MTASEEYFFVNDKRFTNYVAAKWYLDYISKFGFSSSTPIQDLINTLLVDAAQLVAHPLEYGSMFQDRAGTTPVTAPGQLVGHVLDAGGGGYHATAISDAARGVFSVVPKTGRRNLLTRTEEFDNAAWGKAGATVTTNVTLAPDGTNTGEKLVEDAVFGAKLIFSSSASSTPATATVTYSVYVKSSGDSRFLQMFCNDSVSAGRNIATINPETGAVLSAAGVSVSSVNLGGGWYRLAATYTSGLTTNNVQLRLTDTFQISEDVYTGDGTSGIFIWGAQLEEGSTATAYQRVVTEFDVTEAGVPSLPYLASNGVNTAYATPALPAPGVDKVQVFAGLRKLSDALTGLPLEFSPSVTSNNGSFYLGAPGGSGLPGYAFASKGTSQATPAVFSGFAAPVTNVLTGLGDISGDSVILRIDGTQVSQTTADLGTGNYNPAGTYPLYYGARRGTSLFFNGKSYATLGPITRFSAANATAAQIEAAEAYYTARVV